MSKLVEGADYDALIEQWAEQGRSWRHGESYQEQVDREAREARDLWQQAVQHVTDVDIIGYLPDPDASEIADVGVPPHSGDLKVLTPCWSARPGEVPALRPAVDGLSLWLTILSINGDDMAPCFVGQRGLASTAGVSRGTVIRRLEKLHSVPGLLLQVDLGTNRDTGRQLPSIRWATDPMKIEPKSDLIFGQLPELSLRFGRGSEWLDVARVTIQQHVEAAQALASKIGSYVTPVRSLARVA